MKLRKADYPGNYHGFTLKKGFWYGTDTETNQPIATSAWKCNGCVAIYTLADGKWSMGWYDIDETDFELEMPPVNTEGKMTFVQWLEEIQGITQEDYDENYSEAEAKELDQEYSYYFYDGLPEFAQKHL